MLFFVWEKNKRMYDNKEFLLWIFLGFYIDLFDFDII